MPKRNAQGAGTIRQRKDGTWEARYSLGRDPGTGKQKQKSIYTKTQREALKKLQQVQNDLENGSYVEPSRITVGSWMDIWLAEYNANIKPYTRASYTGHIKNQIKPGLGSISLQKLQPHHVQTFYNGLQTTLSAKSIKNVHGVLHKGLEQAVRLGYIKQNPSRLCTLPRIVRKEIKVLSDDTVIQFLNNIQDKWYETIFFVDLFTGMRQGEILGLAWDCVDLDAGTILINKQLVQEKKAGGKFSLDTTKHDRIRKLKPAKLVISKLKERKAKQAADQLRAGSAWSNPWNLVFTDELGAFIPHYRARDAFKRVVTAMGIPDLTFHSMRHSYAVICLLNGDDVKTVQSSLGHHTAAFTLDIYGHVTEKMQNDSANRMDSYISKAKKA